MKTILKSAILIGAMLLSSAAYAGDNESRIKGRGPFKAVQNNEPAITGHVYTTDQINEALAARGQRPLGMPLVLEKDETRTIRTESNSTSINITR